ncbi:uncharacterized protein [Diadema antillarum]|uniref:uncharacterized protein n=1 Tax=Diadema antillarum TaxID=105358 RepID=UPI003A8878DC
MAHERREIRMLLSVFIVLASLVSVYGDRDTSFLQQKFRNRVPSALVQKWRDSQNDGTGEANGNEQWREELLSNLRNVLRKHESPSSQRDGTDSAPYGRQEPMSLAADVGSEPLYLLENPSSPEDNFDGNREDKRNGFFFGKRNGFFFGKRSGDAGTKSDDRIVMPSYEAKTMDECRRCGPQGQGRCVMVGTCCSPHFGCYTFTPEAAACMTEEVTPCQLTAPACGRGGQCVANGICCSAAEGACHLEPACTSMLLD